MQSITVHPQYNDEQVEQCLICFWFCVMCFNVFYFGVCFMPCDWLSPSSGLMFSLGVFDSVRLAYFIFVVLAFISSSLSFWLCSVDPWELNSSMSSTLKDSSGKDCCWGLPSVDGGLSMQAARNKTMIYRHSTTSFYVYQHKEKKRWIMCTDVLVKPLPPSTWHLSQCPVSVPAHGYDLRAPVCE